MRLFHFSEEADIACFVPRPVLTPAERPSGREWLNGPLVWAIEEAWQAFYFFPRECPRILLKRKPTTSAADSAFWWGERDCRMIAHIEWAWFDRLKAQRLYRYELPLNGFEDLGEVGTWVSRAPVEPMGKELISDLPAALAAAGVELRVMRSLRPLRDVWGTTLHASGIRLRNAQGGWEGAP